MQLKPTVTIPRAVGTGSRNGKMTALAENRLDERKYGRLLARTLPRAIETESDYERSLEEVNRLISKGEAKLTPEEDALLELLFTLVEKRSEERRVGKERR